MALDKFWANREQAQKLIEEANQLRKRIDPLLNSEKQIEDLHLMLELGAGEPESAQVKLQHELDKDTGQLIKQLEAHELEVFLSGPHDKNSCIFSINAGAGGTESCDWANMLMRMYQRWVERRGWELEVTDALPGETAGIKSATMVIKGENAYGYCKAERGVHRLVRISPFDSNKRRHTSFASVDAIAEIEEVNEDIQIPPSKLKVNKSRPGAKGGKTVKKVKPAVRITHLPSVLIAASQNQRSQHQNRATAMKLLISKLYAQRIDA